VVVVVTRVQELLDIFGCRRGAAALALDIAGLARRELPGVARRAEVALLDAPDVLVHPVEIVVAVCVCVCVCV
jgi:hypothetical protein